MTPLSERYTVLRAVSLTPRQAGTQLAASIGITPRQVNTHLSNLRAQRLIVADGALPERGRAKLWIVTERGLEVIANPSVRRCARPGAPTALAAKRERFRLAFALSHAAHVARQRVAGIPDALIGAELPDAMPTSGRG